LPQLNLKRTRRDSKVEERQMILDYALRNLKRGPDGRDEIGGRLVLLPGTIKFLSRRLDVNRGNDNVHEIAPLPRPI